jgi:hypothetical protein
MVEQDNVPPRLLEELGLNREQLEDILERYRRGRGLTRDWLDPRGTPEPFTLEPDEGALLGPDTAREGVRAADALPAEPVRDSLRTRFDSADELSLRYRDAVNEYYRAISEQP